MHNIILYAITVLVWGSTWYVITFQLGTVPPLLSIAYRFGLAALTLTLFLVATKHFAPSNFSKKQHVHMALQGLCCFCINYWLFYMATQYLTSGLIAVIFSLIIVMNIINQRILFKIAFKKQVIVGSILGLIGICLVFWPEIKNMAHQDNILKGIALAITATYVASLGNMASLRNTRDNIPVIQSNSYGMAYGSFFCFLIALAIHKEVTFDTSFNYAWSLAYLALFGSVIAFGSYLTLVKNIGSDKAAYAAILFPIVALMISTFFEGYSWTPPAIAGMTLAVIGNIVAMKAPRKSTENRRAFFNLRG